jgi:hypothetical protein
MSGNRFRSSLLLRTQIIGFSFPAATLSVYGKSAIYAKSCIGTLGASMIHCRRAGSSHCSASKTKQSRTNPPRPALLLVVLQFVRVHWSSVRRHRRKIRQKTASIALSLFSPRPLPRSGRALCALPMRLCLPRPSLTRTRRRTRRLAISRSGALHRRDRASAAPSGLARLCQPERVPMSGVERSRGRLIAQPPL